MDLTSEKLKVFLTSVCELAFSRRHPYLFSCGEDQQVYSVALDLNTDVLVIAGRDSTARVWNM